MVDLLRDAIGRTVAELHDDDRPTHLCAHLAAGAVPRTVCVRHPASGLLCVLCAREHHDRGHPDVGACMLCGGDGSELHVRDPLPIDVERVTVAHPSWGGRVGMLTAPVYLWGIVACAGCAAGVAS